MAEDEEGEQYPVAAANGELEVLPLEANSFGFWDGQRFSLRSFPVWYRWRITPGAEAFTTNRPEAGVVNGVEWQQTMGRMVLWYPLRGNLAGSTEDDFIVEMSSWELQVSFAKDAQVVKGKTVGKRVDALSGELFADIRRKLSWWEVTEDETGRWLAIYLAKLDHKAWEGPWFNQPMNVHRKSSFPWMSTVPAPKLEDEKLSRAPAGEPQELSKELCTGVPAQRLCTGIDEEEDEWSAYVIVHLDEESVEVATARVPMEELFAAEVAEDAVQVSIRNEGLGVCWGRLEGCCVPDLTTWQFANVRRQNLPKDSSIKCPAFYNPALKIKLVKAAGHQRLWGRVFAELQKPAFDPPRERMSWTERVQRALVLSPGAPLKSAVKVERAQKLCTRVDTSQDTVTQRAHITLHLDESLEELAFKFKVDLLTFFALKVGERMVEVSVVADSEFVMATGELGGACEPDRTTWEITRDKFNPNDEKEHLALKIGLAKAADSRDRWAEVFRRMEPWEVSQRVLQPALPDNAEAQPATSEAH